MTRQVRNSSDHNTLLQNQNESSFSFKDRKEKYNKKGNMLFTHGWKDSDVLEDIDPLLHGKTHTTSTQIQ